MAEAPQPSPTRALATEARLARRDAILDAVARAATHLSGVGHWEELVPEVLRLLGEATQVSRVYVFEVQRDADEEWLGSQRFEWVAPGVTPQLDNPELQRLPMKAAGFGRWGRELSAGQPVYGDIDDFPSSEQPLLSAQDILSLLVQPIFVGGRWWGFMGFDACARPQAWERVEVDALRIAALVLGAAIQQQEREARLLETQKMEALGRMAGSVAHDFNNVLMVISGALQLTRIDLQSGGADTPLRAHNLDVAEQALVRAASLTAQLLEFSRRRGGTRVRASPVDLLRHEEPLLRQAVGGNVRLRISPMLGPSGIAPIDIDPTQFAQVVLNLAVNARDAMPGGGELLFEISTMDAGQFPARADRVPPGTWTLVTAADTGHGMTPEVRERVFEPFYSTKPAGRGTGLGLATVYSIVTAAGGHLAVRSAPDRGTEFRLYFPAAPAGR